LVKDFLAMNTVTTLVHPPYYPDMATADFYSSPSMKLALKRRGFVTIMTSLRMRRKS
jgi:hypothetical protein